MKKFTTIIIAFLLMGYPLKVDFAQSSKADSVKAVSIKEAELKNKIAANIDTALSNIVSAKTETIQKRIIVKPKNYKPKKLPETLKIIYRDTCLTHAVSYFKLVEPDTVLIEPEAPVIKKLKWYQFKALRAEKKRNK